MKSIKDIPFNFIKVGTRFIVNKNDVLLPPSIQDKEIFEIVYISFTKGYMIGTSITNPNSKGDLWIDSAECNFLYYTESI